MRREELKEGETHDTDQNRMTIEEKERSDSLHALGLTHWPLSYPLPLVTLRRLLLLLHELKIHTCTGTCTGRGDGTGQEDEDDDCVRRSDVTLVRNGMRFVHLLLVSITRIGKSRKKT